MKAAKRRIKYTDKQKLFLKSSQQHRELTDEHKLFLRTPCKQITNRSEITQHFRSLFRQFGCDETKKLMLVAQIMDEAIDILEPVKAKIPRPMSDEIRQAYLAKGYSLEWNLPLYRDAFERPVCVDITTHLSKLEQAFSAWRLECKHAYCYDNIDEFYCLAKDANISPDKKRAAVLLNECAKALYEGILSDNSQLWILDAYAGLDYHSTEIGKNSSKAHSTSGSSKRPRIKFDGQEISITVIIATLALLKDELGDWLKSDDLWHKFIGELGDLHLDPKETGGKKMFWDVSYLIDDDGNRGDTNFPTFKAMLSKSRTGVT
jgi:hypothetical protein